MGIPQTEAQHKELLDIIMQSCQRREDIPLEDGTVQKNLVTDPKTVWYKSLHVASSKLGRFVFELETFSNLAAQAPHHMSKEKAKAFSDQILNQVQAFMYSLDSKSSESIRDNGSSQSTLLGMVARNKIERSYTVKDEKKRSMLDAMLGKDKETDMDAD